MQGDTGERERHFWEGQRASGSGAGGKSGEVEEEQVHREGNGKDRVAGRLPRF